MNNTASETVKVGQRWRDNDPREHGRRSIEVLAILYGVVVREKRGDYAEVVVRTAENPRTLGKRRWIRLDRFNPSRRDGYTLIGERRS